MVEFSHSKLSGGHDELSHSAAAAIPFPSNSHICLSQVLGRDSTAGQNRQIQPKHLADSATNPKKESLFTVKISCRESKLGASDSKAVSMVLQAFAVW